MIVSSPAASGDPWADHSCQCQACILTRQRSRIRPQLDKSKQPWRFSRHGERGAWQWLAPGRDLVAELALESPCAPARPFSWASSVLSSVELEMCVLVPDALSLPVIWVVPAAGSAVSCFLQDPQSAHARGRTWGKRGFSTAQCLRPALDALCHGLVTER